MRIPGSTLRTDALARNFARIGARLKVVRTDDPRRRRRPRPFVLDVGRDRRGEFFELRLQDPRADLEVLQALPRAHHLLLLARVEGRKERFLCGRDERHLFVAALAGSSTASSVTDAMEALKPPAVRAAEAQLHLGGRARLRRRNAARRRQGEWFFIPEPDLQVPPSEVLANEPFRRGDGKAHVAQWAWRFGGELVHVLGRDRDGMTEAAYRALVRARPEAARWRWRIMTRNPALYVRGQIRHPDHRTIVLGAWHRVRANVEDFGAAGGSVAFLD